MYFYLMFISMVQLAILRGAVTPQIFWLTRFSNRSNTNITIATMSGRQKQQRAPMVPRSYAGGLASPEILNVNIQADHNRSIRETEDFSNWKRRWKITNGESWRWWNGYKINMLIITSRLLWRLQNNRKDTREDITLLRTNVFIRCLMWIW